jgi:FlaA1/EpsC-like NDP-sugar epimerase
MLRRFRDRVSGLSRGAKLLIMAGFDALALVFVLWLSFSLRLGGPFAPSEAHIVLMLLAPVLALPVFYRMGLYRAVVRSLPERAIWRFMQAMALGTLLWVFVLFLAEATRIAIFPRTIPLSYFLLGTIVLAGSRFAAKYLLLLPDRNLPSRGGILIYGAGAAGTQLANALRTEHVGNVAGFIDDDARLQGRDVSGVPVYPPTDLEMLVSTRGIREVIVSIASVDSARRREIVAALSRFPVKIRTLPAIADLAAGKYLVNQLREIDIDDLLGRSTVPANPDLLAGMIDGRSILVTGAGGSIGSELCRLIVKWRPARLVLLEANEFALYEIERQLRPLTSAPIVPVLGSVADARLVRRTLQRERIAVVFHTAAHKHVPLLEANALEAIRNNVLGTRVLAAAARELGVERFVLISTDKAVHPSNVMGATKRWAELIVLAEAARVDRSRQRFCAVRFGNVLGSNGSVVPLFREQIAAGGPVTLTDGRMTRYFMSIHEAAELIVQAGAMSEGGDVFLLEMGEPVRIRDLAENMVRLAGLTVRSERTPDGDIAIEETGVRPGEKLVEQLFYDPARAVPTRQPRILRSTAEETANGSLEPALDRLVLALDGDDERSARDLLFGLIALSDSAVPHVVPAPGALERHRTTQPRL